ncbi:HK97 gp10 family phage protein [Lactiplantibacillus sp. WILCCON 0030]|uniref:HK97 gp10 family phage protein n=1 Tax=Lactiplantibacillus brownii TaxID=3069269 RepID=A0ABU1A9R0_9LACO|nr:HK97 gp10 family phage protein [Lactiplantibacillus brownii]MDQ7937100.1 HK97 gp10 family phage protein [Lactiplantibacillus brownii]
MAWGKVDDAQFEEFANKVSSLIKTDELKKQLERSTKRVGKRAMESVKSKTPEGQYPMGSGRTGGHLRRTWHVRGPFISDGIISMKIYNNTDYATYVENGHRTRTPHTAESIKRSRGVHWIPGEHMLMKTMFEIDDQLPKLLTPALKDFMRELM